MKVGLYQDPRGDGMGGGEYCIAVLAHALLAEGHEVELVQYYGAQFSERLSEFFQLDLTGATNRTLSRPGLWHVPSSPVWRRGRAMRDWLKEASSPYDLFVCVTHTPPPFNHARKGVLYVLFPDFDMHAPWSPNDSLRGLNKVKEQLRQCVYHRWWKERLKSYGSIASISEFSRCWTKNYWETDSKVIYPPVDVSQFSPAKKTDKIAVLGRFTPVKNQLGLLKTFRQNHQRLSGWSLTCVGGLSQHKEVEREYFREVKGVAEGFAELLPNASRECVRSELARSRIFWHAMGIEMDEQIEPIRLEHFGIATVEAMAAGCIPIVADRGGQREIVTHGETGFLCSSLDEYVERTLELAADRSRTERMAAAARDRSRDFARPVFEAKMLELLRPYLGDEVHSRQGSATSA